MQQVKQISQTPSSKKNDSLLVYPEVQSEKSTNASDNPSPLVMQNEQGVKLALPPEEQKQESKTLTAKKDSVQQKNHVQLNMEKFSLNPNLNQPSKYLDVFK